MDVSQYLEIFIEETKEHLQVLNEQLLVLEKEPENEDTINEIFRAAHSLKGMAGTMGYKRMQRLTHDMENVFSEIRSNKMKVVPKLVDVLFKGLDALEGYLDAILDSGNEGENDNEDIINDLNQILEEGLNGGAPKKEEAKTEEVKTEAVKTEGAQASACAVATEEKKEVSYELKGLTFAEHENKAIAKAKAEKFNVFQATVYIQDSCILKSARAFLVFKSLEEAGTVIKSEPSTQDIEDEKFDLQFSLAIITKESMEQIQKRILNVSEIAECVIGEVATPEVAVEDNSQQTVTKENVKEENNSQANKPSSQAASKPVVNRSVRVDIEKLDDLMNLVSELIIAKNGLVSINSNKDHKENQSGFNEQIEYIEQITTSLHQSVMKVRMVPIESVVNRFPRLIRDLSKKLDKKMELYMSGEETELDRTVIDEIGDPLMHLLRNAADHGLESNEERVRLGKPETGSIFLNAFQEGNNVVIEVKDDGAGINVEKVRNKAIEKGTITKEQAETMSDSDIIDLLFRPSFSTAEKISDVSGRGVGLDVVKTKIESLGGDIEVETALGQGTSFIIRLPLTLAIIQALMVELGTEKYAIPLGNINTIEDIPKSDIKYVQSRECIHLRGSVIPLVRLCDVLDIEREENEENLTVVIVSKGDKQAGLVVDNLIGQQEIVIKSIGKYINNVKMISGATILGDGEVALILDVNTLV
ncbi:MAG: chemotaxis protein CheA [Lachnospiraceae bacterium]|nr:chemotaxis protein CheA [Lachnospiraceae bacterium]